MTMTKLRTLSFLLAALASGIHAFSSPPTSSYSLPSKLFSKASVSTQLSASNNDHPDSRFRDAPTTRRHFFLATTTSTAATTAAVLLPLLADISPAYASGGATAGKYTTIPIAKRRYYGRVQEAVHEFLLMAPAVIKGDLTDPTVQNFFDVTKTVVVEGKKRDINGVCTKKDGDCKSTDIYDSRYNDMKTTMYLLGNAFRINQQKAPDNLPTVKAAKKFFKQMNLFERRVLKDPKTKDAGAAEIYATALDYLDEYLDLVELPPTDSGHYDQEFSTLVGESSRIT